MTRRAKAKPRKPGPYLVEPASRVSIRGSIIRLITWRERDGRYQSILYPQEARRLAAWLLRAADWLEAQDGK